MTPTLASDSTSQLARLKSLPPGVVKDRRSGDAGGDRGLAGEWPLPWRGNPTCDDPLRTKNRGEKARGAATMSSVNRSALVTMCFGRKLGPLRGRNRPPSPPGDAPSKLPRSDDKPPPWWSCADSGVRLFRCGRSRSGTALNRPVSSDRLRPPGSDRRFAGCPAGPTGDGLRLVDPRT